MDLFASPERKQQRDYVKEGEKSERAGDLKGAVEAYTKALEMKVDKKKPEYMLYYKRACAYEKLNELDKAANDYRVFLSADDRELQGSNLLELSDAVTIGMQRGSATTCLMNQAFDRILSTCEFDASYVKLYSWGLKSVEAKRILKENPQEGTYRLGLISLLEGKHDEAIKRLTEAIKMNPEDARSYIFRGITHTLQIRGGFLGRGRKANELSKANALGDFERVVALRQDDRLVEQAGKWKTHVTGVVF